MVSTCPFTNPTNGCVEHTHVSTSQHKVTTFPISRGFPLCSSGHYPPPPPGSFLYLSFACVWTCCTWNRATCPSWSLALFTHTGCVRFAHICGVRQSSISGCYIVFYYVNTAKFTQSSVDGHLVSLQYLLWIVLVWAWPFSPYRCTFLWREREIYIYSM